MARRLAGSVAEHLAVFRRGTVELIEERELAARLERALAEDRPLRVKFGMDPSSPDLHLGHAIPLLKLRDLQKIGHQIVLIVGDATAMVGDPSGRNKLRPQLTRAEVEANLLTYKAQAARILDMSITEVRHNSEWFDRMRFEEVLRLTGRMTVAQMIERDTFQKRMQENEADRDPRVPLYPLMQAWDSVMIRCDLELGGTDQLFNLLVGRKLQEQEAQPPQVCFTTPLVNGLDGRKMSKSYGNAVALTDGAREMVFAMMRLADAEMPVWFAQLTRLPDAEIEALLAGHPREAKARLAEEIGTLFHGREAARAAGEAFDREVRDKELPDEIPAVPWPAEWGEALPLANLLKNAGLVPSTSDARRVVQQGGVKLGGEQARDPMQSVSRPATPLLVQVGKKKYARIG
jgi:tyrosyl-tRNA synthetase